MTETDLKSEKLQWNRSPKSGFSGCFRMRIRHLASYALMPISILAISHASLAETSFPVNEIIQELEGQTSVPILLPSQLPFSEEDSVYFQVEANPDGYTIDLNYTPDCQGTPCYIGSISAERNGEATTPWLENPRNEFKEILLANETEGIYVNQCGAYCTALVEWQDGDVLYRVTLKNGREEDLEEIANWTIENGEQ
jgi:hypothetical protein